jgi:transposase
MARYKDYSYEQTVLIPVCFDRQIQPGTFEYALNYIVDNELDLSVFESRFNNDLTGAPAYDPAIMLKIILFAYSKGMHSSREIERACRENIIFMALAATTQPHFTTIAHFISSMKDEIVPLFRDVLTLCYSQGLIGKEMFAIDGCKLSANCSKEWSGTKADLDKKRKKIEKSIRFLVDKHKRLDNSAASQTDQMEKEKKAIKNLREKVKKIKQWLAENDDKIGVRNRILQSNLTDNESAKMPTSHGVVQGYIGSAAVDGKHQVIVHAEAFGLNQEQSVLVPMVEGIKENFTEAINDKTVLQTTTLLADSGYHSEENLRMLNDNDIDAYIADNQFRKRDPLFADAYKHRKPTERDKAKYYHKRFHAADFTLNKKSNTLTCPAGNTLTCITKAFKNTSGLIGPQYRAKATDCMGCIYKEKCLQGTRRHPRTVALFNRRDPNHPVSYQQKMIEKFDTDKGRFLYSRRMGIVEPVFANIRNTFGFKKFSHRSSVKVDLQWKLISIVHNISKVWRYGNGALLQGT